MTKEELNSYRLTSLEEPTDEMLSAIMCEAAEDAAQENKEAMDKFWAKLRDLSEKAQQVWEEKYAPQKIQTQLK